MKTETRPGQRSESAGASASHGLTAGERAALLERAARVGYDESTCRLGVLAVHCPDCGVTLPVEGVWFPVSAEEAAGEPALAPPPSEPAGLPPQASESTEQAAAAFSPLRSDVQPES